MCNEKNAKKFFELEKGESFEDEDGSWGYRNEDGTGSYNGVDGSWGYLNEDGTGAYHSNDGNSYYRNPYEYYEYEDEDNDEAENEDNDCPLADAIESAGEAIISIIKLFK